MPTPIDHRKIPIPSFYVGDILDAAAQPNERFTARIIGSLGRFVPTIYLILSTSVAVFTVNLPTINCSEYFDRYFILLKYELHCLKL